MLAKTSNQAPQNPPVVLRRTPMTDTPMSPTEFEAALRAKGANYHIYHLSHIHI